eukprot:scpid100933/ scgid8133/ 
MSETRQRHFGPKDQPQHQLRNDAYSGTGRSSPPASVGLVSSTNEMVSETFELRAACIGRVNVVSVSGAGRQFQDEDSPLTVSEYKEHGLSDELDDDIQLTCRRSISSMSSEGHYLKLQPLQDTVLQDVRTQQQHTAYDSSSVSPPQLEAYRHQVAANHNHHYHLLHPYQQQPQQQHYQQQQQQQQ